MNDKKKISDWMKQNVYSILAAETVKQAANSMMEKRVGTLPVVDEKNQLIGLVTMKDVFNIFQPDFVSLLSEIDFIKDFGARGILNDQALQEAETLTVADIMGAPVFVEDISSLVRALSVMNKYHLQDLPVTHNGVLVGIASQVDIGRGLLSDWHVDTGI